jgi:hypothetical protein
MIPHDVVWDVSLTKYIGELDAHIRSDIGIILSELGTYPYFEPKGEDFYFEKDDEFYVCQRLPDWGDWQLAWKFKYWSLHPSFVQHVFVKLVRQSLKTLPPKKGIRGLTD